VVSVLTARGAAHVAAKCIAIVMLTASMAEGVIIGLVSV